VSTVKFAEGDDGGENILERMGQALAVVELVQSETPFKIIPGGSGDQPDNMHEPIWVVSTQSSELAFGVVFCMIL